VALWLVALVSALMLARASQGIGQRTALGVLLGGAAANLVDIVRRRPILDFISIGRYPAFNLADAAIVTGLIATLGFAVFAWSTS